MESRSLPCVSNFQSRPALVSLSILILLQVEIQVIGSSCAFAQATLTGESRVENARRLIADAKEYKLKARVLHQQVDQRIKDANKLKHSAESLTRQLKMNPEQYKAALSQYSSDADQFKKHAVLYNQHVADFNKTVGQCHANEKQYQQNVKNYSLHMSVFHMPDIKPPHICKTLAITQQEAQQISSSMTMDQKRIVEAEQGLNKAENDLNLAQKESLASTTKAVDQALRNQKEDELAAEFGKLTEEYKFLQIEQKALGGKPPDLATTPATAKESVSAKIKK